jgi:hypothetical protein
MRSGRRFATAVNASSPFSASVSSGAAQQIAQDLPVLLLIIDHKDVSGHDGLACSSTLVGTVNENVDP